MDERSNIAPSVENPNCVGCDEVLELSELWPQLMR
jgi:hypothetical protein